jgi:hypothetical protein
MRRIAGLCLFVAASLQGGPGYAQTPSVTRISIDAAADRHAISPYIYGVNFGTAQALEGLGSPVNRSGGDSASMYNWKLDARNAGRDWFFESAACTGDILDQYGNGFVAISRRGGALPMLTIPTIGWVATLRPDRSRLASFSIVKYGLQQHTDTAGFAEAGNGVALDGRLIAGNDPHDAAQPDSPQQQALRLRSLIARWKPASSGGVPFYLLDNEPGRWHDIHRDVHPEGVHARELAAKTLAYAAMVKSVDPSAKVVAPEELAWTGLRDSGFDQQLAETGNRTQPSDRTSQTGGMDLLPWLLTQWKKAGRPVDVVSVHFYPQAGEYRDGSDDVSPAMQLLRNRSTRALWDPAYHDAAGLIPRLREWVDRYYLPGTPIALTEYNWGAEASMNGATTEADLLGIFGREGLYLATRWIAPRAGTPTYLAMKLFRNYDGRRDGFGETSVRAVAPDADALSAFAALRARDHALTVIAINKQLSTAVPISVALSHFPRNGAVDAVLLADGKLTVLPASRYRDAALETVLPAQSVTLFILHPDAI